MPVQVGTVVEGTVSGITNFGAFIDLGEGQTGLVHISEVADDYVKNIRDYLKDDQKVKVKVLSIGKDGKISLSIKQTALPKKKSVKPAEVDFRKTESNYGVSFDDKVSRFLKDSDEKMQSVKSKGKDGRKGNGYNSKRA
ncbi:RNA binding S1 domain protein [Alkaliphilus metalliredigens QYMF]|uniref:RNA binding S1 domain protein n=1 Tax=Alkaliphilus metalliredigens (strain QYMF) TaxID=293826 RepID=A6TJP1_ALKMQ|nr:S1 RNA-binding domain-containing protein [Alkaliphilus metalliredigens]ABR46409.1 RNA binding S1 domain protein [Alkaliphilus metalliredigens QYMF]